MHFAFMSNQVSNIHSHQLFWINGSMHIKIYSAISNLMIYQCFIFSFSSVCYMEFSLFFQCNFNSWFCFMKFSAVNNMLLTRLIQGQRVAYGNAKKYCFKAQVANLQATGQMQLAIPYINIISVQPTDLFFLFLSLMKCQLCLASSWLFA